MLGPERSFSQEVGGLIVAHRGASATHPENTLDAFEAAISAGADAVEFDVRLTSDGVGVVMHDPSVDRTTDGTGLVRNMTADNVARLSAGGQPIPTLADTLDLVSGRAAVDIEIKNVPGEPDFEPEGRTVVRAILNDLSSTGFTGLVLLSCFDPFTLRAARTMTRELSLGLLTTPDVEAVAALGFANDERLDWVLPHIDRVEQAGHRLVADAHADGLRVGTWITDEPARAMALFEAGIDAVATNDPAAVAAERSASSR